MPKVSVLMNCYNGEKYLKEAIDSIYAQTFTDWEIVFIDNCSTDNSVNIAKYYSDKVKYFKTEKNIPLGAARNFGIGFCTGTYIAFLDTDDVWLPEMLEKQKNVIESGDYALSYAGQIDIDANGKKIGQAIPAYKEGYILGELLLQYDVPLVTAMLRKDRLEESGLNFDPQVRGSEEYCLFMQLAALYPFIVIPEALVKYRVLSGSLTVKTLNVRGQERRYTLDKIVKNHTEVSTKYSGELVEAYARGSYYEAQFMASSGNKLAARKLMGQIKNIKPIYFILYLMLFLPVSLWNVVQRLKYGR